MEETTVQQALDGSRAVFSLCERYRYHLVRSMSGSGPPVGFLMLNPSTADAFADDPTVRRCRNKAAEMGARELHIVNLFAYRATDPSDMLQAARDGVDITGGLHNDSYIMEAAYHCATMVCAWGGSGPSDRARETSVLNMIAGETRLVCLGRTKSGQPRHPLYVANATPLEVFA